MKNLLLVVLIFLSVSSSAQFLQDVNGRPYLSSSLSEYEGSPMLFEKWMLARVKTEDGKVYDSMYINLDIYQNIPLFLRDQQVYAFVSVVGEFNVDRDGIKQTFRRGNLIDKSLPNHFYEVLSEAPLVIRNYSKKLIEVPTYSSANKQFRFAEASLFYAIPEKNIQKIIFSKLLAEKIFSQKWPEINNYATKNKISFKTYEGWKELLKFYQVVAAQ